MTFFCLLSCMAANADIPIPGEGDSGGPDLPVGDYAGYMAVAGILLAFYMMKLIRKPQNAA